MTIHNGSFVHLDNEGYVIDSAPAYTPTEEQEREQAQGVDPDVARVLYEETMLRAFRLGA